MSELILPGLEQFKHLKTESKKEIDFHPLKSQASKLLISFVAIYLFLGMSLHDTNLANKKLSQENMKAFQWVNENISPQSHFLIITGETSIFQDWTQEWFPALTNHVSVLTIQGREWLNGMDFDDRIQALKEIQQCDQSTQPLKCIEDIAQDMEFNFEYVYLTFKTTDVATAMNPIQGYSISNELRQSEDYSLVYQSKDVQIHYHLPLSHTINKRILGEKNK
jgi:hypothetical protein